jgi:hypothetical protein
VPAGIFLVINQRAHQLAGHRIYAQRHLITSESHSLFSSSRLTLSNSGDASGRAVRFRLLLKF